MATFPLPRFYTAEGRILGHNDPRGMALYVHIEDYGNLERALSDGKHGACIMAGCQFKAEEARANENAAYAELLADTLEDEKDKLTDLLASVREGAEREWIIGFIEQGRSRINAVLAGKTRPSQGNGCASDTPANARSERTETDARAGAGNIAHPAPFICPGCNKPAPYATAVHKGVVMCDSCFHYRRDAIAAERHDQLPSEVKP